MTTAAIEPVSYPWFDPRRVGVPFGVRRAGRAFLSAHSAAEVDPVTGEVVVNGGMARQARTAWAKVTTLLEAAGLGPEDVVHVVEYLSPAGVDRYAEAAGVRAQVLGSAAPAVSTVVVAGLVRAGALVELEVTAGPGRGAGRDGSPLVLDGTGPRPGRAWSAGRWGEGLLYLSSVAPLDEHGDVLAEGDVGGQWRVVLERCTRLLAAVGLDLSSTVRVVESTTPAARTRRRRVERARAELLGGATPAVTTVVAPRLVHPRALVCVDLVASAEPPKVFPGAAGPTVQAGGLVFTSAHVVAVDAPAGVPPAPAAVVDAAEAAYEQALDALHPAGVAPVDVVRAVELLGTGALRAVRGVAGVRDRRFGSAGPAATVLGVLPSSPEAPGPVAPAEPPPAASVGVELTALAPAPGVPDGPPSVGTTQG